MQILETNIQQVFRLRADGHSQEAIADRMPFSAYIVAKILCRKEGYGDNILIDPDTLHLAHGMKLATKRRSCTRQPQGNTNGATMSGVLSDYTASVHHSLEAEKKCLSMGVNQETLDILRIAIREPAG